MALKKNPMFFFKKQNKTGKSIGKICTKHMLKLLWNMVENMRQRIQEWTK